MNDLRIRIVDSTADFEQMAAEWEALQNSAASTSIFESFDWQFLWWKTYGHLKPLRILRITEAGEVKGILALYVDVERIAGVSVRVLRFIGVGGDTSPDDLGPLLAPGREMELSRALADHVVNLRGWDVLHLTDLRPNCPFAQAVQDVAKQRRLPCRSGRCERIVFATLRASFEEWLGTLHRDRRYRIRKARKRLNAAHPARFFVWKDEATLDLAIDRLIELHRKRWDASTEVSTSFASPEYIEFHRAVMHACFRRDRLRLYCLELGGEIAAIYYFYRFRDAVFLMQSGFDPAHADLRPGQVLLGHIVEHAIEEGHRVLDFLRGDHRYKDELADGERETRYLTVFARRPGALVYATRRVLLPALKASYLRFRKMPHRDPPDPQ